MIGADGQLGAAMLSVLGRRAIGLTRSDLELTILGSIPQVLDGLSVSALINCSAYTDVDGAESNEALALAVNGAAVRVMAEWAANRGHRFMTFSSDYVFDGEATVPYTESAQTRPINAYGRSKRAGEVAAVEAGALVVRTAWLVSGTHPNFVAKVISTARERPMKVVADQVGSPSIAGDVASASWEAMEGGATGLLHVTNQGSASWFELAREAVKLARVGEDLVTPCSSSEFPTVAQRPRYSVLASERFESLGLAPLPHWSDSLGAVVTRICEKN